MLVLGVVQMASKLDNANGQRKRFERDNVPAPFLCYALVTILIVLH